MYHGPCIEKWPLNAVWSLSSVVSERRFDCIYIFIYSINTFKTPTVHVGKFERLLLLSGYLKCSSLLLIQTPSTQTPTPLPFNTHTCTCIHTCSHYTTTCSFNTVYTYLYIISTDTRNWFCMHTGKTLKGGWHEKIMIFFFKFIILHVCKNGRR